MVIVVVIVEYGVKGVMICCIVEVVGCLFVLLYYVFYLKDELLFVVYEFLIDLICMDSLEVFEYGILFDFVEFNLCLVMVWFEVNLVYVKI